jgi:hypothetical protein
MWSTSVALYFFNIYNGEQIRDEIGTECADAAAVRLEAAETMRHTFKWRKLEEENAVAMTINVVDADGKTVMIVTCAATLEPVIGSSLAA